MAWPWPNPPRIPTPNLDIRLVPPQPGNRQYPSRASTPECPRPHQRLRRHSFNQQTRPTIHDPQQAAQQRPPQPRQRSLERAPIPRRDPNTRSFFKEIARTTIEAINNGIVDVSSSQRRTRLYLEDAPELIRWRSSNRTRLTAPAEINILPMSTLKAARFLFSQNPRRKIGILNFASATSPGGGFLSGARAQEESIARSSTLYAALTTSTARPFYGLHDRDDRGGFYTHSMIYSPDIYLLRDDDGEWLTPLPVDVLTSPAVNAADVRKNNRWRSPAEVEAAIRDTMCERMGRILALFERKGARMLVLGSFGTGVFQNDVCEMAKLWYELVRAPGAPFVHSFDHVVFAIPDFSTQQKFAKGFDPAMVSDGSPWAV